MKIEFETTTDAFGQNWYEATPEIARILQSIATKVVAGSEGGVVFDANGNRCGEWSA